MSVELDNFGRHDEESEWISEVYEKAVSVI